MNPVLREHGEIATSSRLFFVNGVKDCNGVHTFGIPRNDNCAYWEFFYIFMETY